MSQICDTRLPRLYLNWLTSWSPKSYPGSWKWRKLKVERKMEMVVGIDSVLVVVRLFFGFFLTNLLFPLLEQTNLCGAEMKQLKSVVMGYADLSALSWAHLSSADNIQLLSVAELAIDIIALAPTLSKVFEWCILIQFRTVFTTSSLQFGFKPGVYRLISAPA